MSYQKQGFYSGGDLYASQLEAMEDGIINAEKLAMEAANMEKGTGETATQQAPRADKVTQAENETAPHFSFTGHPDAGMAGRIQYGAVGNYSASFNGRSAALNKHAFAINNSTIAKGEESFAQGYETIAEGNSSFAGGSRTWAKGSAAVALGDRTKALGEYSFTNGVCTIAGHAYQTVVGVANENDVESLFEVGNGELDADGNVVEPSTAFRVMRSGKVKIKDIWAKEDDDVIALGFLKYHLNEEVLPPLMEAIDAEFDAVRPYLVLTSDREDKTSAQLASCTASGAHSVAFGHTANATENYTAALGKNVSASADYAIAMGVDSSATEEAAFAAGVNAVASGAHSRAFGTNVNAGYVYQTVIGKNNINKEKTLFEIGNGADTDNLANAFEVYEDGLVAVGNKVQQLQDQESGVQVGYFNFTAGTDSEGNPISKNPNAYNYDNSLIGEIEYGARGKCASAFGGKCAAIGSRSHAEGTATIANGSYSHTEGSNTVAYGTSTHAEGTGSFAYGEGAHAEGGSQALGKRSHAEGQGKAEGDCSHAEGSLTHAKTAFSHAEGLETVADGAVAHAEGGNTYASGDYSHAEGQDTHALGEYSHTEGQDVQVSADARCSHGGGWKTRVNQSYAFGHGAGISVDRECQAVFGQYNEVNENAMFIIGNGSDENPLNIFEVLSHGDVQFTYRGTTYSLLKLITKLVEKGYVDTNDIKA